MYLHLYSLWPAVAAAVNRDDRGRQKTTIYGGITRARWSSQSQKARIRAAFADTLQATAPLTRRWDLIAEALAQHGTSPTWAVEAARLTWQIASGGEDGLVLVAQGFEQRALDAILEHQSALLDEYALRLDPGTEPDPDADAVALFEQSVERKARVEERFTTTGKNKEARAEALEARAAHRRALAALAAALLECEGDADIAFNGRMVAQHPRFGVESAVSVKHAIGTGAWRESNVDYFTAYDRLGGNTELGNTEDTTGSAMIGNRPNGTALYYRYAVVNTARAAANLGVAEADVIDHALGWARCFTDATPVSYASSTAPFTPPVLTGAVTSHRSMANLVGFCATPIEPFDTAGGALLAHHADIQGYAATGTLHYWTSLTGAAEAAASERHDTWDQTLAAVRTELETGIADA